jgi:hypothetical protein
MVRRLVNESVDSLRMELKTSTNGAMATAVKVE